VTAPENVPDGYTVNYCVDGTNWTTTIPKGTGAGEYTVRVKYVGDGNHEDFDGSDIIVTIEKQELSTDLLEDGEKPTAKDNLEYTGGEQQLVSVPVDAPDGYTVQYSVDGINWSAEIPVATNAGDYTVHVKYVGDVNHTDFVGDDIVVTIGKQDSLTEDLLEDEQKPTANTNVVYNGGEQQLLSNPVDAPEGYTVQYSLDGTNWSSDIPTGTGAGDYTVHVRYVGDANHEDFAGQDITVNIGKQVILEANDITEDQKPEGNTGLSYTGGAQQLVSEPIDTPDGFEVQYSIDGGNTWSTDIPTATDAGDYVVKVKYVSGDNYEDVIGEDIGVSIAKMTSEAGSLSNSEKPSAKNNLGYTGNAQALLNAPVNAPEGYTIQYSTDGVNWSTEIPTATDVGSYTIHVKYVADENHEDFDGQDIDVMIKYAAPTQLPEEQKPAGKTDLIYTGEPLPLIEAPSNLPEGYMDVEYALGADAVTVPTSGWITSVPTAVEAGTYYVWYRFIGDDMHQDTIAVSVTVVIKEGTVTDITEQIPNSCSPKIENSNELKEIINLTEEEKQEDVDVWLEVKDVSETVEEEEKSLIQDCIEGEDTVGIYLDVNLYKKVGDNNPTKISSTSGMIKVSIVIPESLRQPGREFKVIRVHDGVVSVIQGVYDPATGVFTFETDRFSAYAIVYTDQATVSGGDASPAANTDTDTAAETHQSSWIAPLELNLKIADEVSGDQVVEFKGDAALPYDIMKYLQEHPQITLVYHVTYDGEEFDVRIPGAKVYADPTIEWYGPLWLKANFGPGSAGTNIATSIKTKPATSARAPKTGEESDRGSYIIIMSCIGVAGLLTVKRKRKISK
jgi:LPXTG-motif cell wall-anchored protein